MDAPHLGLDAGASETLRGLRDRRPAGDPTCRLRAALAEGAASTSSAGPPQLGDRPRGQPGPQAHGAVVVARGGDGGSLAIRRRIAFTNPARAARRPRRSPRPPRARGSSCGAPGTRRRGAPRRAPGVIRAIGLAARAPIAASSAGTCRRVPYASSVASAVALVEARPCERPGSTRVEYAPSSATRRTTSTATAQRSESSEMLVGLEARSAPSRTPASAVGPRERPRAARRRTPGRRPPRRKPIQDGIGGPSGSGLRRPQIGRLEHLQASHPERGHGAGFGCERPDLPDDRLDGAVQSIVRSSGSLRRVRRGHVVLRPRLDRSLVERPGVPHQQRPAERRQALPERSGVLVVPDRRLLRGQDRARVHPLVHQHHGDARPLVALEDRPLHGRGAAPPRQQRRSGRSPTRGEGCRGRPASGSRHRPRRRRVRLERVERVEAHAHALDLGGSGAQAPSRRPRRPSA